MKDLRVKVRGAGRFELHLAGGGCVGMGVVNQKEHTFRIDLRARYTYQCTNTVEVKRHLADVIHRFYHPTKMIRTA